MSETVQIRVRITVGGVAGSASERERLAGLIQPLPVPLPHCRHLQRLPEPEAPPPEIQRRGHGRVPALYANIPSRPISSRGGAAGSEGTCGRGTLVTLCRCRRSVHTRPRGQAEQVRGASDEACLDEARAVL